MSSSAGDSLFCIKSQWNLHFPPADELATLVQQAEAKAPEELTEEDKMALLGRPKAGDVVRAQLRIKESKEFKVSGGWGFLFQRQGVSTGREGFPPWLIKDG